MKQIGILLGVLMLLLTTEMFSQQDPQYTQYMYNQNVMNPAYAGSRGVLSLGLLGRTQWVGIAGAPETMTLSIHSPISNSVGLGFSVIHDEIGPAKEDNAYVDFSYTIPTSAEGNLAFGIKAGFTFLNVRILEGLTVGDQALNEPINKTSPNFGAGVYYYTNKFYAGLSIPNFLQTRHIEKGNGTQVSTASEKMHYFFTTGYVIDLNERLKLKPSAMVKAAIGAPLSIDLSANALINEKIEIGFSYRLDDSISGIIGFNITDDFRLGYAYDHTTSSYGAFNNGSHEVMLLFDFNRRKLKSPRFF